MPASTSVGVRRSWHLPTSPPSATPSSGVSTPRAAPMNRACLQPRPEPDDVVSRSDVRRVSRLDSVPDPRSLLRRRDLQPVVQLVKRAHELEPLFPRVELFDPRRLFCGRRFDFDAASLRLGFARGERVPPRRTAEPAGKREPQDHGELPDSRAQGDDKPQRLGIEPQRGTCQAEDEKPVDRVRLRVSAACQVRRAVPLDAGPFDSRFYHGSQGEPRQSRQYDR